MTDFVVLDVGEAFRLASRPVLNQSNAVDVTESENTGQKSLAIELGKYAKRKRNPKMF